MKLPHRHHLSAAIAVLIVAVVATCRGETDDDPKSVLSAGGLVRFGEFYALPIDAGLPDRLRQIQQAQSRQSGVHRQRLAMLSDIDRNELLMSKLLTRSTMVQIYKGLDRSPAPDGNTTLGNQHQTLSDQISAGQAALKSQFDDLRALTVDPPPGSLLIALADELESAAAEYDKLKADPAISAAIQNLQAQDPNLKLGPAKGFDQHLSELRVQREGLKRFVVPTKSVDKLFGRYCVA